MSDDTEYTYEPVPRRPLPPPDYYQGLCRKLEARIAELEAGWEDVPEGDYPDTGGETMNISVVDGRVVLRQFRLASCHMLVIAFELASATTQGRWRMQTTTLIQEAEIDLTTAERAELGRYEAVIKRGLDTFVEVGNALVAIRDGKLYRADYSTFDEYCRGRWNMSRSYAYRTIDAAEVVANLLPIGDILPTNEAQARPLAKLEPTQQRVVWQEAVSEAAGKPTAAHVEKAVERVRPPRPKPTPPPAKVVYVEPTPTVDFPPMPHDLDARGFEFCRVGDRMWAIYRAEDTYQSNWHHEPADCIADVREYLQDEVEAIALVEAETAQEDAERAARDAQRPSYERVPEPVVAPATDNLERLKRASLLRYMLIQARDAARRNYFDLVGLDVVVSRYARAVDEMLEPLDSFIRCLEGKK